MKGIKSEDESLEQLRRLCSMREYCHKEVYVKALDKTGGDAAAASRIADRLLEENFVNQRRYAMAFVSDKARIRAWGPNKIRAALASKGIAPEIVDEAIQERAGQELFDANLTKKLQRKAAQLRSDPDIKVKLLRYGASAGYSYDTLYAAIEHILINIDKL